MFLFCYLSSLNYSSLDIKLRLKGSFKTWIIFCFLFQSSLIITPCRVSRDDIVGQGWIEVFLKQSAQNIKKAPILTVLNGVNKRSSILSHVIEQLKEDGVQVAETCISQRVCFAETNVNKISVIDYNKQATEEIVDFTNEVLNLIKSEA